MACFFVIYFEFFLEWGQTSGYIGEINKYLFIIRKNMFCWSLKKLLFSSSFYFSFFFFFKTWFLEQFRFMGKLRVRQRDFSYCSCTPTCVASSIFSVSHQNGTFVKTDLCADFWILSVVGCGRRDGLVQEPVLWSQKTLTPWKESYDQPR